MKLSKNTFLTLLFIFGLFQISLAQITDIQKLKVLHFSFHNGCIKDFEAVGRELNLDLTSWYIYSADLPRSHFDGYTQSGNAVFNMSHERAEKVWEKHKDYFNQFDLIITSDTAPLSRIFLQNNWQKPLIIWICNRFDYFDCGSYDGKFPDKEYYELFRKATKMPNVKVIGYVAYEHFYAAQKGIDTGWHTIKPLGALWDSTKDTLWHLNPGSDLWKSALENGKSYIPENIKKEDTLFIPPRLADHERDHLLKICDSLGIKAYCGPHNGPYDIQDFKGILHFPYAWSNISLFENLQMGLPHFVPSIKFLHELSRGGGSYRIFTLNNLEYCEWYCPENNEVITYFDSWEDLKHKVQTMDYSKMREKIRAFGKKHKETMLARWNEVFEQLLPYATN